MPRRFSLAVPGKNAYSKKRGRTVSVQHVPLMPETIGISSEDLKRAISEEEMKVSLPLSLVWDCKASTLARLQGRIKTLSALPRGTFFYLCMVM